MIDKLSRSVFHWLTGSGINVSGTYLAAQLRAHPDYPSLVSITDTLDSLGIDNLSLVADKDRVQELPVPFLTHSGGQSGHFIVISNALGQVVNNEKFRNSWDGIVVLLEKPANWHHTANEAALAADNRKRRQHLLVGIIIAALCSISLLVYFTPLLLMQWLTSVAGLGLAILIVQEELGIGNVITEQLCGINGQSGCNSLIRSSKGKPGKWPSWADTGIIYFIVFFIVLNISPATVWLPLFTTAAIPFIFFSVFYQWKIAKRWCRLCLATLIILAMQFILSIPALSSLPLSMPDLKQLLCILLLGSVAGATWLLLLKPALQRNHELQSVNFAHARIKNDPEVFAALLRAQRQVDTTPFAGDLQLGNAAAPVQLVVACNPYCAPCASTHMLLHELAAKKDIGLTIRFTTGTDMVNDVRAKAVRYCLQLLSGAGTTTRAKLLHDWYGLMDLTAFSQQYPLVEPVNVEAMLQQQQDWCETAKIAFTPTVFINGFEMPPQYQVAELGKVLAAEIKQAAVLPVFSAS